MNSEMVAMRLIRLQDGYATTIAWRTVWRRSARFQVEGVDELLTFEQALEELSD